MASSTLSSEAEEDKKIFYHVTEVFVPSYHDAEAKIANKKNYILPDNVSTELTG